MRRSTLIAAFSLICCNVYSFPRELAVYEFGSRNHAFGGLRWDNTFNHPKPYAEPINDTLAGLFQYLTPDPMPSKQFPMNQHTICWNVNIRVFGFSQTIMFRFFHEQNQEWSHSDGDVNGDYWFQLNYSPDRGTLIMTASMISDKTKNNIWSGGLGAGNYTTADNPLLRWSSLCIANDFRRCWTRYFIGEKIKA